MTHINQRRDTASNWTSVNPVLQMGEVGWERDTLKAKLGDGETPWNDLDYAITPPGAVTKADVGLGNVDNTSDANKPVSTATQTALNIKADGAATLAALNLKAPLDSPVLTGNPTAPTPASTDSDTSIATTAFVKTLVDTPIYLSRGDITGDTTIAAAWAALPYPTALEAVGVTYNATTFEATVTKAGRYYVSATLRIRPLDAVTRLMLRIVKNPVAGEITSGTATGIQNIGSVDPTAGDYRTVSVNATFTLAANDRIGIHAYAVGGPATRFATTEGGNRFDVQRLGPA